ncbi:hypothetical protein BBJ28_00002291 [Nothophytophthora sp. Chile5]|nr:hypothetical protein BBJ28_00002291 [Nothophytophthora sp. Chile5]
MVSEPEAAGVKPLIRRRFQGEKVVQEMRELSTNHIRSRLVELEKEKSSSTNGSSSLGGNHAVRNMILTLVDFASIPQVRVFAAENMETWLQNPSVKGPARDLLGKIVSLCSSTDPQDLTTVDLLLKLKLKSTMFQLKVEAITQLVRNHPIYLNRALSMYIARERPNNMGRDVDNIKMLQHIFRASRSLSSSSSGGGILGSPDDLFYRRPIEHQGTAASRELARVFRELASASEVAPVLKPIVRKILKQLTFEQVDIKALCVGILENEGHWDALAGDARLLDYMGLVTGIVWLILLMRGAAVKSLQIQQSNAASRQGAGSSSLGSSGLKHGSTQAIPRRNSNQPLVASRALKLGSQKGKQPLGKSAALAPGHGQAGATGSGSSGHGAGIVTGGNGGGASEGPKTVKISVWAKEELQQALAFVQREAIVCCRDILTHFGLSGDSPFEKMLYECTVKKLLFLEIPPDVQPTEHDRTCFQSTKEEIPVHEDSLELLTSMYNSCKAIDRMEALRTLETIVFRGAEAHLHREALWRHREDDLVAYGQSGGVIGIDVKSSGFVPYLLKMAQWEGDDEKREHEFCHSSRFWICCSILLIVGCFNPNTVGTYLWEEFPTLRGLMQMVITGRYAFPAINTPDSLLLGKHKSAFSDLLQGNLQLREYEQQLLQLNQGDPAVIEDPLMLFEVDGLARQPPPAILEHLRTLDRKFKLGVRLRQSREKDFLMEMVAGNDDKEAARGDNQADAAAASAGWIADIVCEDFDTVQYLPYGCLCQLLLLALRGGDAKAVNSQLTADSQTQAPSNQPALTQIVPRLLLKLREYLAVEKDSSDVASNVVMYYLECLNSPELSTRRVAAHILHLLTTPDSGDDITERIQPVATTLGASSAADAMDFSWLLELAKLPCYYRVRSKIFLALEKLLELEASIPSLRTCVKALHKFWKEGSTSSELEDGKTDGDNSNRSDHPKKSAIEQSLLLARAYGKLLAGRDFVSTLLLKDREIYSIMVEVAWRAIESQLEIAPQLKATSGISFSDCKVFYVADAANNIREIKLPLGIVHGSIQVLCSPHAHDQAASESSRTAVCFAKLTQSLFPKATSNAAILSSTGLIATKDPRLYPDHLLAKLAAAASITNAHLCATAVRAMSCQSLWTLLERSALTEQCFDLALQTLLDTIQRSEGKAVAGLQAATKESDLSEAADAMLLQLGAYGTDGGGFVYSTRVMDKLRRVREWLQERSSSGSSTRMATSEDDDEALLLSEGFTTFKIQAVRSTPATASPFYAGKPVLEARKTSKSISHSASRTPEAVKTDAMLFEDVYFRRSRAQQDPFASDDSGRLLTDLKKELKRSSSTGSLSDANDPHDFVFALSQTMRRLCPNQADAGSSHSPAESWALHMSILHFARSSCNSCAAAAQLAEAVLEVVDHLAICSSAEHRRECCGFVRRVLENFREGFVASYSATVSFVRHLVQVSTLKGLQKLENPTVAVDVYTALQLIVELLTHIFSQWKARGVSLHLDAMTLHSLVVLVKEEEVLRRSNEVGSTDGAKSEAMDLILAMAKDQPDENTMLNLLDPILAADPQLVNVGDAITLHADALYFQNPKRVAGPLDALHPGWESLISLNTGAGSQRELVIGDRQLLTQVDDTLRDLTHDGSEVMEHFRELARCHPLLVLSRFPRQLMQLFGTVSITQIYLNTALFQNILNAMEILRPHVRYQPSVLNPFCQFMFEILRVIADHHATEFHQLISHIWDLFYEVLDADFDLASDLIFSPPRCLLLDTIVTMYASHSETIQFGTLMTHRHSERNLRAALEIIEGSRSKSSQQQTVEQLLLRLARDDPISVTSKPLTERTDMAAVAHGLQAIDHLCAKSQQETAAVALLRRCAAPVATLLVAGNVTKALMTSLCQTLLNLMKHDSSCVDTVMRQYVQCLGVVRSGLKEAAVTFVLEFLAFADARQRRQILQQLFDDRSDVAKTKLTAYMKSATFRTMLLNSNRTT